MKFRDYEWYCKRYEEQKSSVEKQIEAVKQAFEIGEYDQAASRARSLEWSLNTLNNIANQCADMMPEDNK